MPQLPDSQLFATPKAPYIKYLENIKGRWPEAESLDYWLKRLIPVVERYHEPVSANRNAKVGEFVNVAEILDIHEDASGKHNQFKTPTSSLGAYNGLTLPDSRAVENFLHQIRRCDPAVHTRLVVLHNGRCLPGDRAADTLFFCHVLGVELDLPPTDVRNLAQLYNHRDGWLQANQHSRQCLPMKPGFVSLGLSQTTGKRSTAAYIGRRNIGAAKPHVGEISVQRSLDKTILMRDSRGSPTSPRVRAASIDPGISRQPLGTASCI